MDVDDLNEPLLHIPNPIHQQNQSILEKHQQLTVNEKLSLVLESGSEITSLEQELREIDLLNSRGFLEVDRLAGLVAFSIRSCSTLSCQIPSADLTSSWSHLGGLRQTAKLRETSYGC